MGKLMKKYIIAMILGATPVMALADNLADAYFSKQNPKLTPQEEVAIAIAKKWQTNSAVMPIATSDGTVRFAYGIQQIVVVCAPLQVCDVELQPGEQINTLNIGDPRFTVEPAVSGAGATEATHLIIKAMDAALDTSLVLTTNRRTYHIRLRSHRTEFMPRTGFSYPEDAAAKWDELKIREAQQKQAQTLPQTKENINDLNFAYVVEGSAAWKPVRVYNNGVKTIIQMPSAMAQTEAPTLLVVRRDGGLFTDEETVIVNYRLQGDRYIVDTLFDKAILISGVGSSQDRVTITKGE